MMTYFRALSLTLVSAGCLYGTDGALAHPQGCPGDCTAFITPGGFNPTPTDLDGDGIEDAVEQRLLNMFAPISIGSVVYPDFQDPGGVPVSVSWMVRNGVPCRNSGSCCICGSQPCFGGAYQECLDSLWIPIGQFLAELQSPATDGGCSWSIKLVLANYGGGWASNPEDRRSWSMAQFNPEHTYGRAWRPWPSTHPHLVSLQYYSYYTYSDADDPVDWGAGDHHGDWGAIDITVDLEANRVQPPILHMVYHNHGRQFFMTPEFLPSWSRRPLAYLERGSNEPWPNAGENGFSGWPVRRGWGTNRNFSSRPDERCLEVTEDICFWTFGAFCFKEFCREWGVSQHHRGNGYVIDWLAGDASVPNVGDNGVSLCGIEGEFLQAYKGRWGNITGDGGSNPRSPLFQPKIVNRCWGNENGGPWESAVAGGGPFTYNNFGLDGGLWAMPQGGWELPVQRPEVYVDDFAYVGRYLGRGVAADPYASLDLGISMVLPHGSLKLVRTTASDAFRQPRHLTKPLTLEAVNGPVTLGGPQ